MLRGSRSLFTIYPGVSQVVKSGAGKEGSQAGTNGAHRSKVHMERTHLSAPKFRRTAQ
ncbi:hypothetical protein BH10CYA1_BH10CYA1_04590 [soil metagenome]